MPSPASCSSAPPPPLCACPMQHLVTLNSLRQETRQPAPYRGAMKKTIDQVRITPSPPATWTLNRHQNENTLALCCLYRPSRPSMVCMGHGTALLVVQAWRCAPCSSGTLPGPLTLHALRWMQERLQGLEKSLRYAWDQTRKHNLSAHDLGMLVDRSSTQVGMRSGGTTVSE
jgi:hypothetical protein